MKRSSKYVGLDVHQATTVCTMREQSGRVLMRTVVATEPAALVEYFRGMRGQGNKAEKASITCTAVPHLSVGRAHSGIGADC